MILRKQNPVFLALAFGFLGSVYRTISSGGLSSDVLSSTLDLSMIPGFDGVDENASIADHHAPLLNAHNTTTTNFTSDGDNLTVSISEPGLTNQEETVVKPVAEMTITENNTQVEAKNLTSSTGAMLGITTPHHVDVLPLIVEERDNTNVSDLASEMLPEANHSGEELLTLAQHANLDEAKKDSLAESNVTTAPAALDAAQLAAPSNESRVDEADNRTRWGDNFTSDVIFYNIFIHPSKPYSVEQDPLRIVEEQMKAINSSGVPSRTLFYNLIGRETNHSLICPPGMDCRRLAHHSVGNEVTTIQDVYEFCVDYPNHTVTYIHDKGSFNVHPRTATVRHYGTKGAVSSACLTMPLSSRFQCNACAFNLHLEPNVHTSANMWTARCSLVSQLFPPKDYEAKRRNMYLELLQNKSLIEDRFPCLDKLLEDSGIVGNGNMTDGALNKLGLGRYSMEVWLWSHPDTIPCVVAKRSLGQIANSDGPWNPKLQRPNQRNLVQNERILWYRKEGRLWEMDYIYGRHADESQPFWTKLNTSSELPPAEC